MPKKANGTVVTWADRPVGVQFCPDSPHPAPPRRTAVRRPAPTRPW